MATSNKKTKILMMGPSPNHIGGVAIHIKRLTELLQDQYTFDFVDEMKSKGSEYFNIRSLNIFKYLSKVFSSDIVHIHSGPFVLRAFHIIVCKLIFNKKVYVTIHKDIEVEGKRKVRQNKFMLRYCNKVILVNNSSYKLIFTENDENKYILQPAFLPPILDNETSLDIDVISWINDSHKDDYSILCSNAWSLNMYNNEDLYGLDICIYAIEKLKNEGIKVKLIFVIASVDNNKELLGTYKRYIKDKSLDNEIYIYERPLSFVRLILESDVVLRTTNTDGDALSVRESLFFNKPIIASDIVNRPEGTILFQMRDVNDLVAKIKSCLSIKNKNYLDIGESIEILKNKYKKIYND